MALPAFPRLLRRADVEAALGLRRSALYQQVQRGLFPRPIYMGPKRTMWLESDVAAVINARIAGADNAQIRAVVEKLHAERGADRGASEAAA